MAHGVYSNLADFEALMQEAYYEKEAEVFDLFNANSNGTITMQLGSVIGNHPEKGYFSFRDSVARRDVTATTARTFAPTVQDTYKGVSVSNEIIDAFSVSALARQGVDYNVYARNIGENAAEHKLQLALSDAIASLVGTLTKQASTKSDVSANSANNTASVDNLFIAKELMGDRAQRVRGIVMHSKAYYDIKREIGATSVASQTEIAQGVMLSDVLSDVAGAPVFITDNSQLKIDSDSVTAYDRYHTLLLTDMACSGIEDETLPIAAEIDRTLTNSPVQITGEYAVEYWVKGFSYTDAGDEPTTAALATTTNWTLKANSIKDAAGVVMTTR